MAGLVVWLAMHDWLCAMPHTVSHAPWLRGTWLHAMHDCRKCRVLCSAHLKEWTAHDLLHMSGSDYWLRMTVRTFARCTTMILRAHMTVHAFARCMINDSPCTVQEARVGEARYVRHGAASTRQWAEVLQGRAAAPCRLRPRHVRLALCLPHRIDRRWFAFDRRFRYCSNVNNWCNPALVSIFIVDM